MQKKQRFLIESYYVVRFGDKKSSDDPVYLCKNPFGFTWQTRQEGGDRITRFHDRTKAFRELRHILYVAESDSDLFRVVTVRVYGWR